MACRAACCFVMFLSLGAASASAGDCWGFLVGCRLPNCVGAYECDDYCGKCLPCPRPVTQFQCDDYRPKCAPFAEGVCDWTCDDFCRKPFAFCCRPWRSLISYGAPAVGEGARADSPPNAISASEQVGVGESH